MTALDTAPARGGRRDTRPQAAAATLAPRRSTPHLLLGAVLMVTCALVFGTSALRADQRAPVLTVAGPVAAGQVLTDADLLVVRIVPDPAVAVVPEARRASVVGRTVTLPLAAGSLLSDNVLGPAASWPPAGQSVIAVPVKAGRAPAGLAPGVRVTVVLAPRASSGASGSAADSGASARRLQAPAAVVAVSGGAAPANDGGAGVVSLLMASPDAERVAAAGGEVALLVQGGGG